MLEICYFAEKNAKPYEKETKLIQITNRKSWPPYTVAWLRLTHNPNFKVIFYLNVSCIKKRHDPLNNFQTLINSIFIVFYCSYQSKNRISSPRLGLWISVCVRVCVCVCVRPPSVAVFWALIYAFMAVLSAMNIIFTVAAYKWNSVCRQFITLRVTNVRLSEIRADGCLMCSLILLTSYLIVRMFYNNRVGRSHVKNSLSGGYQYIVYFANKCSTYDRKVKNTKVNTHTHRLHSYTKITNYKMR